MSLVCSVIIAITNPLQYHSQLMVYLYLLHYLLINRCYNLGFFFCGHYFISFLPQHFIIKVIYVPFGSFIVLPVIFKPLIQLELIFCVEFEVKIQFFPHMVINQCYSTSIEMNPFLPIYIVYSIINYFQGRPGDSVSKASDS